MNRAAAPSINAVLANKHYHDSREAAPESPVSPATPGTPQFSWPRRVRSPEPHVPLRKASPERLSQRAQKPPFITTNGGSQALGPATASSVAVPHQSRVNVVKNNRWWEEADDDDHVEQRQRQLSSALDHPFAMRQRQLSAADATLQRQGSWPLADRPEVNTDELRTSYRSAMTSASSHMDSTIATTRSSVATADSSVSDCVKIDSSWADEHAEIDEDFTVDDALDMYLGGFGTPNRLSVNIRGSIDSRRGSFPHGHKSSIDSTTLRPGTSPLRNGSESGPGHRRSHSASIVDRKSILLDVKSTNKPSLAHTRTSTEILTGRNVAAHPLRQIDIPTPLSPPPISPPPVTSPSVTSPPVVVPRDRYGFKKTSLHITLEAYDAWEKDYNQHLERRRAKWNTLMRQFGYTTENPTRFPTKSEKIKRYVRKGIPPAWRGAAWFWYAGGPGKLAKDPGLYWNLLHQVNEGALSDNDREHIERDLNRTFPDNIRFKPDSSTATPETETSMIKALRRVLQAFAVHNPNIGYCQSLNFIAGLLLLFLNEDEEKAFVLLNVITTEHLPGTHGVALEGANIDIAVLMTSIKESLPSIWAKLDDKPTTPAAGGAPRLPTVSLATTAWFMSLFVGTLPIEPVLRVWDCLFFEGSKTLFRVALAIFKSGESNIKKVSDPMEIFQVVQSMPRQMLDANALMECCFKKRGGFGGLSQDVVERRRQEGRTAKREGRVLTTGEEGRRSLIRGKSRGRFRRSAKGA